MRGLPFPSEALFNREQSHDFGSPGPNGTPAFNSVAVPIDPMLSLSDAGPAYFHPTNGVNGTDSHILHQDPNTHLRRSLSPTVFQRYAQGPQGDPFAPQLPPHFFPSTNLNAEEQVHAIQKPVKRKRRPRREEDCGFCGGNDSKNRRNGQERMVACDDCGRSGHPSCMELGDIGETLRGYPWKCIECKICEICKEKGDDERILFCDNCDRGWHMYCLDPPLEDNPEGSWFCPLCAPHDLSAGPLPQQLGSQPPLGSEQFMPELVMQIDPALQMDIEIDPALREASVASSSHVVEKRQTRQKPKPKPKTPARDNKGKGRAAPATDDSEEVEVEVGDGAGDVGEAYAQPSSPTKGRVPANGRRRENSRSRRRSGSVPDDVEAPSPPLRPQKRMKLTIPSPPPRQKQAGFNQQKMVVRLRLPPTTKGKGKAREEDDNDESKKGLFDDLLNSDDRDTMKTTVLNSDKDRFEKARVVAESKVVPPPPIEHVDLLATPGPSTGRFPLRSTVHQLQQQQAQAHMAAALPISPTPSTPGPSYPFPKVDSNVLRIRTIRFGPYDIQTWYDAPFPEEFSNIPEGRLWICEFCLKYMKSRFGAQRHRLKCKCRHPPGDEIYRDGIVSIFEVDGRKNKIYCQNLCLLSKMFLDHKSLFYDVEPFLFYVMTEVDDIGARFVGYFSKEKRSSKDLNLSCIMTLPVRQRQGWGNLLIDFSYLLSKKEQRNGTPERPLSALGAIGYKKYWTLALMRYLLNAPSNPRLEDISAATSMNSEDIHLTLIQQNMIIVHEGPSSPVRPSPGRSIKLSRGRKNGIARRNLHKAQPKEDDKVAKPPFAPPTSYDIYWDSEKVEKFLTDWESKGYLTLKPERLKWTPFLVSREDKLAQALEQVGSAVSIDVEGTPVEEDAADTAITPDASTSASATASVNAVDAIDGAPQTTPKFKSEASADVANAPELRVTAADETVVEDRQSTAERKEVSPVPSPLPAPPIVPRSSIGGLEALAAVAYAVSKANPVDLRRRSLINPSPVDGDLSKPERNRSLFDTPSVRPSSVISRQNSEKGKDRRSPVDAQQRAADDRASSPRRLRSRVASSGLPESGRERTPSPSPLAVRNSVEKDAELAAQLAREESFRRRSLRSSSNSVAATPALAARDLRPKETPRKRRKPLPIREPSPPAPLSPDRPTTRRQAQVQAQARAVESAMDSTGRKTRRQSSRLSTNGGGNEMQAVHTPGLRSSSRLNGTSRPTITPSPTKSGRGQQATRDGPLDSKLRSTRARQKQITPEPPKDDDDNNAFVAVGIGADLEGVSDADADGEPDILSGDDARMDEPDEHAVTVDKTNLDVAAGVLPSAAPVESEVHPHENGVTLADQKAVEGADGQATNPNPDGISPLTIDLLNSVKTALPAPDELTKTDAYLIVEDDDIDAEGEPDDEDADGEPDPDVYQ
ncbi:hypothetical protein M0805_008400 [Coniferiporia weirii]|nr:hypothetical protein M0805_008400 [Coniferiporia weirii]